MWIYIPDPDETKDPWIGTLSRPENQKSMWSFELIRHVDAAGVYQTDPFNERGTVIGLLDHQQKCTLIRPFVLRVDPGSVGVRLPVTRTRIEGECHALLTDLAIKDADEKIVAGMSLDSEAFSAWFGQYKFTTNFDPKTRTPSVEIKDTERNEFDLSDVGHVTCMSGAEVSSRGRSSVIRSAAILRLVFAAPASLNETLVNCFGLERLFGFLIGFRGRYPSYKIWLDSTYKIGEHELHPDGKLDVSGVDWQRGEPPHPMDCVHLRGLGGGTPEKVLANFLRNRDDILTRIHVVEFNRFFSKNLLDRFSVLMPVLEAYLKNRYTAEDEENYITSEKTFFDWVDRSDDHNVIEFCRKHVEVKRRKSPSLKTLLLRAIAFVNEKGFVFPLEIAERLQKSRGRLFHSAAQMGEKDVRSLYEEVQAATGLLMLHTYDDLGVDLSCLAGQYSALSDFRSFLVPPTRAES